MLRKAKPVIGLNGRFLVAQRTGVQRSAYHLFRNIIKICDDYEFVLFTSESELYAEEWRKPNVKVVATALKSEKTIRNHIWEQFALPRLARKHRCQILHSPANLAPIFYRGKSIVNLHDLCFLVNPEWFAPSFRLTYRFFVPLIAKNSSVIFTNSNHSKNDILELLGSPVSKIRLGYWAVDPMFFSESVPYEDRKPRILYVGSLEPRKNLSGLLQAFNIFRQRNPNCDYKLTLVGCESSLFSEQNYELGEYKNDIEFVGYVRDHELARIYADSKMLVYPSFYEGFGFPPLEAMASGTPVVTSWNSSLPEVVGKAALLTNPQDPLDIALKIEQIYTQERLAHALIERGRQQVQKFSWEKVATHTIEVYEELLSQPSV